LQDREAHKHASQRLENILIKFITGQGHFRNLRQWNMNNQISNGGTIRKKTNATSAIFRALFRTLF